MVIFYGIIFLLALVGIRIRPMQFNEGYLSRERTLSIKGIFVLLVFCSHLKQYIQLSESALDTWYIEIGAMLGQLIVVMFFFYSGYGVFKQIQKNGANSDYTRLFLKRRLLPVWIQFAICVSFFLIVDLLMGLLSDYSLSEILLSVTGWTSIGNSNWFMFITFALYLIVFFSFRCFRFQDLKGNLIILTAISAVLFTVLFFVKESYWWDTLFCFPIGMWFAYLEKPINTFMRKNKNYYLTATPLLLLFLGLWFFHVHIHDFGKAFAVLPPLFALSVVVLTMKVKIGNKILDFFGKHVFSIYILQRIPMIVFEKRIDNRYLFFIITFTCTVALAIGFDYLFGKAKAAISEQKKEKSKAL